MRRQMRLVILVSISLFYLGNPAPLVPVVIAEPAPVKDVTETLMERRIWLAQEAAAYALHKVARITGVQAREIVRLVLQETTKYEYLDYHLVLGLIVAESNGNDRALSWAGARGLMQIMPYTGRFIASNFQEEWKGLQALYEVERSIRYGVWYLNHLQELFPEDEQAMIAAYNWGPDNIRRRQIRDLALPRVYPGKVQDAKERLQEEMYEFCQTVHWRSLDLGRDLPYFEDHPSRSASRPRRAELPIHDGEGELLREGSRVQQMSRILPGGD